MRNRKSWLLRLWYVLVVLVAADSVARHVNSFLHGSSSGWDWFVLITVGLLLVAWAGQGISRLRSMRPEALPREEVARAVATCRSEPAAVDELRRHHPTLRYTDAMELVDEHTTGQ